MSERPAPDGWANRVGGPRLAPARRTTGVAGIGLLARRLRALITIGLLLSAVPAAGAAPAASPDRQGGYVSSFELTGAVARPRQYTLADLQRLPAIYVASRCLVEGTSQLADHAYKGVPLWTLVAEAQLTIPEVKADPPLRGYVVAIASDGFPAIVPLVEIDPAYNRRDVIVAYERDGQLLDPSLGMAQLVVPGDATCARNVFWLARLEVRYVDPATTTGR
jgi:DMSO/TMAO reductase YedYZ molybdopterin-dependent catalytic subunit